MKRTKWFVVLLAALSSAIPVIAQGGISRSLTWEEVTGDAEESKLRWPVAVAAGSGEQFAVADAFDPRLVVFSRTDDSWEVIRTVSLAGTPRSLAHDGTRYLISMRQGAGLVALEGDRFQIRDIGLPRGTVPGALAGIPGGGFLIRDDAGGRILVLDHKGRVSEQFPVPGNVAALVAAPGGSFFTVIADEAKVRRHGPDGEELASWSVPGQSPVPGWPVGLVITSGGEMLVLDRHSHRIVALDASGRLTGIGSRKGWDPGLLLFPADMTLLPGGRVAVADQGNGRVQIFRRAEEEESP